MPGDRDEARLLAHVLTEPPEPEQPVDLGDAMARLVPPNEEEARLMTHVLAAGRLDRILRHPLALLVTLILVSTPFVATYVKYPQRAAARHDPAHYSWRIEALLENDPGVLQRIGGPMDIYPSGYRVATPVIGAMLRRIPGVGTLKSTVFLLAGIPILLALSLGGLAYRFTRDVLAFHLVSLGSAGLLINRVFVYIDNAHALLLLTGGCYLLEPARRSWAGRMCLAFLLLLAGFTHPTTLVTFCAAVLLASAIKILLGWRRAGPALAMEGALVLTILASLGLVYLSWTIGIWGRGAEFTEAAQPPPRSAEFFFLRLRSWVDHLDPWVNAPLLVLGIFFVVLLAKRKGYNDLTALTLLWSLPVLGALGFLTGAAYPYYRFLNATVAWVLLIGLGLYSLGWVAVRGARRGGAWLLLLLLFVPIMAMPYHNFRAGRSSSRWEWLAHQWVSPTERRELEALRGGLLAEGQDGRPVVLVIDAFFGPDSTRPFNIFKQEGNVLRYGIPSASLDHTHVFMGAVTDLIAGQPTYIENPFYDRLGEEALEDIERERVEPVIAIPASHNRKGHNLRIVRNEKLPRSSDRDVWLLKRGEIISLAGSAPPTVSEEEPGEDGELWHYIRLVLGFLALPAPGLIAARKVMPDAGPLIHAGLGPVLSVGTIGIVAMAVLAVTRQPLSQPLAWFCLAVAVGVSLMLPKANDPLASGDDPRSGATRRAVSSARAPDDDTLSRA